VVTVAVRGSSKFAVIVPGPFIVAVAEVGDVGFDIETCGVELAHDRNVF
jgi:hypothetical protein